MLTTGKTVPTTPRRRRRTSKATIDFSATPQQINGINVEEIKPVEGLPGIPLRIALVRLEDGTTVHACLDCQDPLDFVGTRGDVMAHRNAVHGARYGKKRPKVVEEPKQDDPADLLDAVLAPRGDGAPAPGAAYEMTLGEILALAPTLKALGDLVERAETEVDAVRDELRDLRQYQRDTVSKLAGYEATKDEVVGLRVQIRAWGNYEAIKAEMYQLRAWKRDMIKKLKAMGFQLTEEEQ